MDFGGTLAQLRRSRGWSQQELALRAGMSQRHISFLETGRSKPGSVAISKLSQALGLRGWEHRAMLDALGSRDKRSREHHSLPQLASDFLDQLTPWPSYAFQPDGTLISTSKSLDRLFETVAPNHDLWAFTAPSTGPNIYDLVFHPKGLLRWMLNPGEVIPETLRRLQIEATHDMALRRTLDRAQRFPSIMEHKADGERAPPVLIERYALGSQAIEIISVISHLASPGEYELDQLRIESFVPHNEESASLLRAIQRPAS